MLESKSQVATFLDKIVMSWQLATLAQLVEQLPRKEQVRSSILLGGSSVVKWRIFWVEYCPFCLVRMVRTNHRWLVRLGWSLKRKVTDDTESLDQALSKRG